MCVDELLKGEVNSEPIAGDETLERTVLVYGQPSEFRIQQTDHKPQGHHGEVRGWCRHVVLVWSDFRSSMLFSGSLKEPVGSGVVPEVAIRFF